MIKERADIFMDIYNRFFEKMILFHFTKINEDNELDSYKKYVFDLKNKYMIKSYIVIIIHSSSIEESHYFENNILFIVKKVNSYKVQLETKGIDNNRLKYKKVILIILI